MAKPINIETRERLKEAVHDMTILADDGIRPTDALVKVAREQKLTTHQIKLAAWAYNTSQSTVQRESGTTVFEKLGAFPLADAEAAIKVLEDEQQSKTASVQVASVYKTDIDKSIQRNSVWQTKLAAATPKKKEKPITDSKPSFKKVCSDRDFLKQRQHSLKMSAARLKTDMSAVAAILRTEIAKEASLDKKHAWKLAASQRYGKDVKPYLDGLLDSVKTDHTVKTANVIERNDPVVIKIGHLKELGDRLRAVCDTLNTVTNCLGIVEQQLEKRAASGSHGPQGGPVGQGTPSTPDPPDESDNSLGDWLTHPLQKTVGSIGSLWNQTKNPQPKPNEYSLTLPTPYQQFGLEIPSHKFNLDEIRTRSMLNDFMYNDEIISSFSDESVKEAFNSLMETAPQAMQRPEIARTMVREYLAKGALGSYDLAPLVSFEKEYAKLNNPEQKQPAWFDSPSGRYEQKPTREITNENKPKNK